MKSKLTAIAASVALSLAAGAYAQTSPTTSASPGQQSQKDSIDQQHRAAMEKCNGMKDNAKNVCKAEADGQKTVSLAQAKLTERDTPKNQLDLEKAKAEAQYKVAKAQCGDQAGALKKACEKEAKAMQDLTVAKAEKQSLTQTSSGGGAPTPSGASTSGASSAGQPTSSEGSAPVSPAAAPPSSEQPKAPSK